MVGGVGRGVGVVHGGVGAEVEAQAAVGGGWNGEDAKGRAVFLGVHPGDGVREFKPGAIAAFEREPAQEVARARDGKSFASGVPVTHRVEFQRFAVEGWADGNFQRGGLAEVDEHQHRERESGAEATALQTLARSIKRQAFRGAFGVRSL